MNTVFLNTKEASRRFGIPERTLMFWREKRRGPVYYRVGRQVLYKAKELESFIAAGAVEPKEGGR